MSHYQKNGAGEIPPRVRENSSYEKLVMVPKNFRPGIASVR